MIKLNPLFITEYDIFIKGNLYIHCGNGLTPTNILNGFMEMDDNIGNHFRKIKPFIIRMKKYD